MSIISYFEQIVKYMQERTTRVYLIFANVLLVVFGIWFSNAGLLPFAKLSDFLIFSFLVFLFSLYRPGWAFLFFIGTIALENINLAPVELGFVLRPYQFFGFLSSIAFIILYFRKRIRFDLPKWSWIDLAVLVFSGAGFVSAIFAQQKGVALKQSVIMLSFVLLYFLVRIYIQSFSDLKKVLPFFLSSSAIIFIYSICQNIRFARGLESFEVMPGRPNATFTEPDWYGMFLVFVIAVVYVIIYNLNAVRYKIQDTRYKQNSIFNTQIFKPLGYWDFGTWLLLVSCFLFLVTSYIVLILTVARSAWIGAFIVSIGFLKIMTFGKFWNFRNLPEGFKDLKWKEGGYAFLSVVFSFLFALGIVVMFNLTTFELGNRAQSTASGLQEITISCAESEELKVPEKIGSIEELNLIGCRHINLEEIESEKNAGKLVSKTLRPDPNVVGRNEIYAKSWNEIKANPIMGIGWGNIGKVLGADDRGSQLNSSNIFLEIWLGSGIVGLISFVLIILSVVFYGTRIFLKNEFEKRTIGTFVTLGVFAIIVPNLFNAGIFLGFLWMFLAIAVSLVTNYKIK